MESTQRWIAQVTRVAEALTRLEDQTRRQVEQLLAARGLDAQKLREFEALSQQAKMLPSYESNLSRVRERHAVAVQGFQALKEEERHEVVGQLRRAFDRVLERVTAELGGRVRVTRLEAGDVEPLQNFLLRLQERGVTRWWNALREQPAAGTAALTPDALLQALESETLDAVGMSGAVASTFSETMTRKRRRELTAVRCPDLHLLEMQVAEGEYRRIDELSGGQRVSLLLSLLLETQDNRPLVIDQPEDQLDNRFLWATVLPALRRLKGRRQVIVATHNANIVVNGDADLVILLEADAHRGRVALIGAIEDPLMRKAIVETVDGGGEAFRLRKLKYGI